jgi:hypothetical protein
LFENIFIARVLSKDDLEVMLFELPCIVVTREPDDSEDSLVRDGREEVLVSAEGGWLSALC